MCSFNEETKKQFESELELYFLFNEELTLDELMDMVEEAG